MTVLPFMNKTLDELTPFFANLHLSRQCVPGVFEKSLALSVLYLHYNPCHIFRYIWDRITEVFCSFLQSKTSMIYGLKWIRNIHRSNNLIIFLSSMLPNVEAYVAERLTPRTLDLEVHGSSLARCVDSLEKELYSTFSPFTQVYKWVPATYCWGVTPRWTSISSRGE